MVKPEFMLLEVDGRTVQSEINFNMADRVYVAPGKRAMKFRLDGGQSGVTISSSGAVGPGQTTYYIFDVEPTIKAGHTYFAYKELYNGAPAIAINDLGTNIQELPKYSILYNGAEYFGAVERLKTTGSRIAVRQ